MATLRVDPEVRELVKALARRTHQSANEVVHQALSSYADELFWRDLATGAREDPHGFAQDAEELAGTLREGLDEPR